MTSSTLARPQVQQAIAVLGMATLWPSIHNQLLYPLSFTYHKEGAGSPYYYYLVYSAAMLVTTLMLAYLQRRGSSSRLLATPGPLVAVALVGAAGLAMLVLCDFTSELSSALMMAGAVLAATFVPVYFIFWSQQLVYGSVRRVAYDLALSYAVFGVFTMLRLGLGLHAWLFALLCPLVSAALAVASLRQTPPSRYAENRAPLRELPLHLLVPCVLFVYAGTVGRFLLIPVSAAYEHPPYQRIIVYAALTLLMVVLAVLFRPGAPRRARAELSSFMVVVVLLIGCLLLTGLGSAYGLGIGNLPVIAGVNALEVLVWILLLVNAQSKHIGIVRPAALYLIFVIGASHLMGVLIIGGVDLGHIDLARFPIAPAIIGLGFLVVVVANGALALMLSRAQRPAPAVPLREDAAPLDAEAPAPAPAAAVSADGLAPSAPACLTLAADEAACQRIQEVFGLSRREADTLRLAARSKSAREIAESLFVAESTVNSHLKSIYRKCDVHSRRDLVALVNRYRKEEL